MTLTPKHTIFIAISNYLTVEINKQLRTELSKNKSITSKKFIEIIEKYFDFKIPNIKYHSKTPKIYRLCITGPFNYFRS